MFLILLHCGRKLKVLSWSLPKSCLWFGYVNWTLITQISFVVVDKTIRLYQSSIAKRKGMESRENSQGEYQERPFHQST